MSDTTDPRDLPAPRHARGRLLSSALGIVLAGAVAVGVNMLADDLLGHSRLDLTQQKLYTLSPGTRQVLAKLHEPITLRFFYSRRLGTAVPLYGAYADRVREMLQEYAAASNGRVRLEEFDPEPFSETEDRALGYGLQGVPVDQSGEQVYFGLAGTNLLDDERIVGFFQPDRERFLEYDLTRLVWELSNPTRTVLGVMTPLTLNGDPRAMMMQSPMGGGGAGQPAVIMQQLKQFFTVKDVPLDAQVIDPSVQVLLLAQPQDLSPAAQYAVDQFVMRGGKLLLMVDPHSEGEATQTGPGGMPVTDTASSLDRLLNAWGVDAPHDKVVLDLDGAWRVRAGAGERMQAVDYLAWFNLRDSDLNKRDVATAQLSQVTVASAGELRQRPGVPGIEFTPILRSSDRSEMVDAAKVRSNPNPADILAAFRPDGQRHVIGARVRGVLNSAFPDGPPPEAQGQQRPADFPAHVAHTAGPANFVVINDTDILEDRFWVRVQDFFGQQVVQPISDNSSLVSNLVDTLAGGDNLISLRSRGESLRPFTRVEELRADAEAQYRQTERELTQRLTQTENRLRQLRQGGGQPNAEGQPAAAQTVITPEQRAEIDRAREQILQTRQQLRAVQRNLRRSIEGLETTLRILNIALVPALVALFAIGLAVWRARRRRQARA